MRDIERSLADLAAHVDYPPAPDLAPRVAARVRAAPARRGPARARLVAAAALVLVVAAAAVALPPAREAIADFLGLGGVRIRTGEPVPAPSPARLELGEPMSLAAAQQRVDFDVAVPDALGSEPEVFYDEVVPGGQVALLYAPAEGLPAAPGTNAGALITQFEGRAEPDLVKKSTGGSPETTITPVQVNGSDGLFLAGRPHVIAYVAPDGSVREETVRLAGNVLLWSRDGVTYRIESLLDLRASLRIARSLR